MPDRNEVKDLILRRVTDVTFSQPINGYNTWAQPPSRRLKLWTNVDPSVQPALFLTQHSEDYDNRGPGTPPIRWLNLQLWCYASSGAPDSGIVGDTLLDVMEQALEGVLAPPAGFDELSLGGVYWIRIMRQSNLFIRDPGDLDGQALLIFPVRVLMP